MKFFGTNMLKFQNNLSGICIEHLAFYNRRWASISLRNMFSTLLTVFCHELTSFKWRATLWLRPFVIQKSLASLLQRCHRRVRGLQNTPSEGQAASAQASINAGCSSGIVSAWTIWLWCLWQGLCLEDWTDFTSEDSSVMRYVVSTTQSINPKIC